MDDSDLRQEVRRAARGDQHAAALLFDHYYPRVFRFARAKLRTHTDAEDVAAETFARVLRGLERFRWKGGGFEAWLFRIAGNLVVDRVRASSREHLSENTFEEPTTSIEETPETALLQAELTKDLESLLDLLAPEQREVLLLRFAGGLDTQEVGSVMGKNANAVRQLQFRALQRLRQMMDAEVGAK